MHEGGPARYGDQLELKECALYPGERIEAKMLCNATTQ